MTSERSHSSPAYQTDSPAYRRPTGRTVRAGTPQLRRRPRPTPQLWAVLALALAGAGQFYFNNKLPLLDGSLFYVAGMLAFWRMLSGITPQPPLTLAKEETRRSPTRGPWAYLSGSLALALTVGALMGVATKALLVSPQLLVLGAGAAWVLTGALLDGGPRAGLEALRRAFQSISRRDGLVLGGILLLAATLRFFRLGDLPFGLWYDEASIGLEGHRILTDSAYRPLYTPSTSSPAAFVYLVAGAEALFGKTVFAVRFVPALIGVLSTLLSYAVGRKLFGPWAGLCAAALFAVARWDINFSRIGMQGATAPFLALLTCALALAALQSRRMALYAALGVSIGSLSWFYTASVFFPAVLFVSLSALIFQERGFLKAHGAGVALALAGALLAAGPVLLQTRMAPEQLLNRSQQTSIFRGKTAVESLEAVRKSLGQHLLMFNLRGDSNGRHNLPGEPMLDWLTGVFMLFGVVAALRFWRDARSLLLLSWLFVMLLPGVLSLEFEAPQALRSIGVIPAAVLLATLGLERFTVPFRPFFKSARSSAFAVAGVALVAALNAGAYFGAQANDFAVWNGFSTAESVVGRRLAEADPKGERALVSVFYRGHPTVRFYSGASPETLNAIEHLPLRQNVTTNLFMEPQEEATYQLVRYYYPKADCTELRRRPQEPVVLYTCTVPSDVITASQGLVARYTQLPALGTPASSEQLLSSTAVPPPTSTGGEGYSVEVAGSLLAPTFGAYRFALDGPATVRFSLDEKERLVGGATPVSVELARGLHQLRVSGSVGSAAPDVQLRWQPPGGEWGIVPQDLLFHGSVRPMGLVGSYVPGATAGADVAFRAVDASPAIYFHVPPLAIPFNTRWTGSLYAERAGAYRFTLSSISSARLEIAGKEVVATQQPGPASEGAIELASGWHKLQLDYLAAASYAQVFLRWHPPGGPLEILPPAVLRPW